MRRAANVEIAETMDVLVAMVEAMNSKMINYIIAPLIIAVAQLTGKNPPGAIGPPGNPSFAGN